MASNSSAVGGDNSAANLIVITDSAQIGELEAIASSRPNRTILPFSTVDIEALKAALRREPPGRRG
jgi:hypothetical protein